MEIVEQKMFTLITTALRTLHPNMMVTDSIEQEPSTFPAAWILETRTSDMRYQTLDFTAKFENSLIECQLFSNKKSGAMAELRAMCSAIETELNKHGYLKVFASPIENGSPSVRRFVCRFTRLIGENDKINIIGG